jgi:hypothetical protein
MPCRKVSASLLLRRSNGTLGKRHESPALETEAVVLPVAINAAIWRAPT